jgi:hypothetical protein
VLEGAFFLSRLTLWRFIAWTLLSRALVYDRGTLSIPCLSTNTSMRVLEPLTPSSTTQKSWLEQSAASGALLHVDGRGSRRTIPERQLGLGLTAVPDLAD